MKGLTFLLKLPIIKTILKKFFKPSNEEKLSVTVAGIKFPNRVGLAAGFDKDARYLDALSQLGFGFLEMGTVTPKAQAGNDLPRLFRLPKDKALLNRMGFNNDGVEEMLNRLKKHNQSVIIGGNIGKNKVTPNENATQDYLTCFEKLHPYVDYFTVNVSSPNTPNLRNLQDKEPLKKLLSQIQQANNLLEKAKPIFLKISPDNTFSQLDDIIEIVIETKISGIIATNTTINREHLITPEVGKLGAGGISGKPLKESSTKIIKYLREKLPKDVALIASGGIMTSEDAMEKLQAGADLVQIYTGFIYEGPSLIGKINQSILQEKS